MSFLALLGRESSLVILEDCAKKVYVHGQLHAARAATISTLYVYISLFITKHDGILHGQRAGHKVTSLLLGYTSCKNAR